MTEPPIVTPPGWKRYCPHCRSDVVAFRDHDLTCMFCDGKTRSIGSPHGTGARYNQGCRCADCCAAQAARMRAYRAKKRGQFKPEHVHGTENGYRNYGCRCDACREAARVADRKYHGWAA